MVGLTKAPTDWNDLHCLTGLAEVRRQLLAQIEPALQAHYTSLPRTPLLGGVGNFENTPPPFEGAGEFIPVEDDAEASVKDIFTLDDLMRRYVLVEGKTEVYDSYKRIVLKKGAFEIAVTKKLAKDWYNATDKKIMAADAAKRIIDKDKLKKKTEGMFPTERYIYLDGTQEIWDNLLRERLPAAAVKLALGDAFSVWLNSKDRKKLPATNIVFDPTMKVDPAEYINTFEGLPLEPVADYSKCNALRYLILFLCNGDKKAAEWLTCWLAYPLQNIGAKMDTSVLLHSTMEGSGKSFLLSDIMRKIYGDYGATVGQAQLESSWSIWQSNKLYGVFEEVVSRDQRFNQVGKIKHMITGKTVRIESKFMNGWEEANYMNAVFLSNELMPWPISENDRRMFVIWPKETLPEKIQRAVAEEIKNQGIEAFYHFLLNYDVGDFNERTRPPNTEARQWLVDVSRTSWETFLNLWKKGDLGVSYDVVAACDIYGLYREWCSINSEHAINNTKFSLFIKKYIPKPDQQFWWYDCDDKRRRNAFYFPSPPENLEIANAKVMGEIVRKFRDQAHDAGWHPEKWEGCSGWKPPL